MRQLLVILSFLMLSSTQAQQIRTDSIFITGAIWDADNVNSLPYTHFKFKNKSKSGMADKNGKFQFWVSIGDTIQYSYIGYHNTEFSISDSLIDNNYITGVFLTKDTVNIEEVLILPRFGDFAREFLGTQVNTKEYVRAVNNINTAKYVALTTSPKQMDATANIKMMIDQHISYNENKAFIPTSQMIGVSTTHTLREIRRLKRKADMKIPEDLITDSELNAIERIYRHSRKKKRKK
ncbi:MAG: carboxypeptidase-like regulatory domain-containing protein [Marinifilaceae bacterium]|jgi:hypothetical protein|nr:carboxypeptidase-like regulatory domain-containing protein [Marinifilaceae bacterium]